MRNVGIGRLRGKIIYILLTFFYMAIIAYISLQPVDSSYKAGVVREVFHNLLHIPAYGLLAYLVLCCFSLLKVRMYIFTFIIATLYGIFIEFCQSFIPGRFASLMDIFLNTIGVILVLGFIYYFNAIRSTHEAVRE
ncbi:MAG: hypothetical protein DRP68_04015 [Candidatus Omnitrophota bacterium]|nr:MAG: hypothetical protein DRP68_04015 [Candidatus Omnitrophota bacterium]